MNPSALADGTLWLWICWLSLIEINSATLTRHAVRADLSRERERQSLGKL
jgi:hypothetical protein